MAKKKPSSKREKFGKTMEEQDLKSALWRLGQEEKPHEKFLDLVMIDLALVLSSRSLNETNQIIPFEIIKELKGHGYPSNWIDWAFFNHYLKKNVRVYHRKETLYCEVVDYGPGGPEYGGCYISPRKDMPDLEPVEQDFYSVEKTSGLTSFLSKFKQTRKARNNADYGVVDSKQVEKFLNTKSDRVPKKTLLDEAVLKLPDVLYDLGQEEQPGNVDRLIEAMGNRGHSKLSTEAAIREHCKNERMDVVIMNRLDLGNYDVAKRSKYGNILLELDPKLPAVHRKFGFDFIEHGQELYEWWHSKDDDGKESNSVSGNSKALSGTDQREGTDVPELEDGPISNGIRLEGKEYKLMEAQRDLARQLWNAKNKQVVLFDLKDSRGDPLTVSTAQQWRTRFNKVIASSGWEVSFKKDVFELKKFKKLN